MNPSSRPRKSTWWQAHELITVKVQGGCELNAKLAAGVLTDRTRSSLAQVLGRTILLYRQGQWRQITPP